MKQPMTNSLIPINSVILPDKEIKRLIRIAQTSTGKEAADATERIIDTNVRLILACIQKVYSTEDMDDLFQVGCIGLIKAIQTFDFAYDVKFNTYAMPTIINELKKYTRKCPIINVSRSIREAGNRINAATAALKVQLNREPTCEEIAKAVNLTDKQVQDIIHTLTCATPLSLDEPVKTNYDDYQPSLEQIIPSSYDEDAMISDISLRHAISKLPDREQKIVCLIAINGLSQKETAALFNLSQAQISRIYTSALRKIKKEIS